MGMSLLMGSAAAAQPMTKEQGDIVIKELREIRQLLAKQATQAPAQAPAPAAAAPTAKQLTLKEDGVYALGRDDATLTLVEFTDYQCPFCSQFEANTLPELKKNYIDTGKLRIVLRDLPLEFHQFALGAAQAARCAGDQGHFWEMKTLLFKNQTALDLDSLATYAGSLSLDIPSFKTCISSGKHLQKVRDDASYARSLNITGTPSFVLGRKNGDSLTGTLIVGAQPLAYFDNAIKDALQHP